MSAAEAAVPVDGGFLLTGLPLLGITITATFLGLVLIMLIALTFLLLLRKSGCLRRRGKRKAPVESPSEGSTKLLLRQPEVVSPSETNEPNRKSNGHALAEPSSSQVKSAEQQPFMPSQLPSPPDVENGFGESYNGNSWTTRNTSFKMGEEEKAKVVEKLRKPNAQIIAELDDEPDLSHTQYDSPKPVQNTPQPAQRNTKPDQSTPQQEQTNFEPAQSSSKPAEGSSTPTEGSSKPAEGSSKPAEGSFKPAEGSSKPDQNKPKSSRPKSSSKRRAPTTKLIHNESPSTSPPKQASPSTIFSPTRTSGPPTFPITQNTRPKSQGTPRHSLSSPDATTRASDSPGSSLATSGASSPNTVIYKPTQKEAQHAAPPTLAAPEVIELDSEPKPRRMSGNIHMGTGLYRAVPIPEHEEVKDNEITAENAVQQSTSATTPKSKSTYIPRAVASYPSSSATRSPTYESPPKFVSAVTPTSMSRASRSPTYEVPPAPKPATTPTPTRTSSVLRSPTSAATPISKPAVTFDQTYAVPPVRTFEATPTTTSEERPMTTSAARPKKLKIPPPTLPKPKYVLKKPARQDNSSNNIGHYDVPRVHQSPISNISGSMYPPPSTPSNRQSFNRARSSIASSPAFSQEALSNARHSLATSPDHSPAVFPQALRNDSYNYQYPPSPSRNSITSPHDNRNSRNYAPVQSPIVHPEDLQHSRHSLPGQNLPISQRMFRDGRHSVDDISRRHPPTTHPAYANAPHPVTASPDPYYVSSRQPYSRHSIASTSVLSPHMPPWERPSPRGTPWGQHGNPSPSRIGQPRFVTARDHDNMRPPVHQRASSLHDNHPSSPTHSNIPRMRSSISGSTPSTLYNYPMPGHPRKVATIKPNSSMYHSFQGHLHAQQTVNNQYQRSYNVRPPTVDDIEDYKMRQAAHPYGSAMVTRRA